MILKSAIAITVFLADYEATTNMHVCVTALYTCTAYLCVRVYSHVNYTCLAEKVKNCADSATGDVAPPLTHLFSVHMRNQN